jgi:hypothetical protein
MIFPKTPIIIAMNLNTTEKRRTLFETMIAFLGNIKVKCFENAAGCLSKATETIYKHLTQQILYPEFA